MNESNQLTNPPVAESITFNPTDPEILWILGRPCFVCGPIAHILQAAGHEIILRAENEQAAVIIWMIKKYQEHGASWKTEADKELSALNKARMAKEPS